MYYIDGDILRLLGISAQCISGPSALSVFCDDVSIGISLFWLMRDAVLSFAVSISNVLRQMRSISLYALGV